MKRTFLGLMLCSGLAIAPVQSAHAGFLCVVNPVCWIWAGGRTILIGVIAGAAFTVGKQAMRDFLSSGDYVKPPKRQWQRDLVDDWGKRKEDGESLIVVARCMNRNGEWYPVLSNWTACPMADDLDVFADGLDYNGKRLDLRDIDIKRKA